MKKIIILAVFFLTCGSLFAQLDNGARLPSVDLKTLDGETFSTKQMTTGEHPFIVSLWATWCMPCREELDAISLVYEDWVDEFGVTLFAVSIDDSRSAAGCQLRFQARSERGGRSVPLRFRPIRQPRMVAHLLRTGR